MNSLVDHIEKIWFISSKLIMWKESEFLKKLCYCVGGGENPRVTCEYNDDFHSGCRKDRLTTTDNSPSQDYTHLNDQTVEVLNVITFLNVIKS